MCVCACVCVSVCVCVCVCVCEKKYLEIVTNEHLLHPRTTLRQKIEVPGK